VKPNRRDLILSELAKRQTVGVAELAALLGVSEATVRRDLGRLEADGLLRRIHGGACLLEEHDELPYAYKVTAFLPEKKRIGAVAASLVQDGQVIGCSGGTTVSQFVRALMHRSVTVVTNAVTVAMELARSNHAQVIVTGGLLRGRSYELVGTLTERALQDFNLDVAVIGVDGLSVAGGLTTFNQAEAYANRALISRAREVWVVADHSKLGKVTPAVIAPIDRLHRLITDSGAMPERIEELRSRGIEVILA
jgi:DeoR/GlpR family transcriptional regulator of sugar metabolism